MNFLNEDVLDETPDFLDNFKIKFQRKCEMVHLGSSVLNDSTIEPVLTDKKFVGAFLEA